MFLILLWDDGVSQTFLSSPAPNIQQVLSKCLSEKWMSENTHVGWVLMWWLYLSWLEEWSKAVHPSKGRDSWLVCMPPTQYSSLSRWCWVSGSCGTPGQSLCRPWDPPVYQHKDCWDFGGKWEQIGASHCVRLPAIPSLRLSTSPCVPHMESGFYCRQGIVNSVSFPLCGAWPPPVTLLRLCFVLPTSRALYGFVWFVVVVCSCHRFLCCCCAPASVPLQLDF